MNLIERYYYQPTYRQVLIALVLIGLQLRIQYLIFLSSVERKLASAISFVNERKAFLCVLQNDLNKLQQSLDKLSKNQILKREKPSLNLNLLLDQSSLSINNKKLNRNHAKSIYLSAHGSFLQFYSFLNKCQQNNFIVNNFYLQKEKGDQLLIFLTIAWL